VRCVAPPLVLGFFIAHFSFAWASWYADRLHGSGAFFGRFLNRRSREEAQTAWPSGAWRRSAAALRRPGRESPYGTGTPAHSGRVSLSTLNVWMFGSRITVKKVRNSLTWFSHGSGATSAPEPLGRVPFSTTRVFETLFFLN